MTSPSPSMITRAEPLAPWLAGSVLVLASYTVGLVVGSVRSTAHLAIMTVALCAVLVSTQLVVFRSRRTANEERRELSFRPASDELEPWVDHGTLVSSEDLNLPPYATGMLLYTSAVIELLEHAIAVALDHNADTTELAAGRDDAAALHHLLETLGSGQVHLHQAAKVHTICSLWEASHERCERAAAELDADFYQRWRARNISVIRLRHGERPRRTEHSLPYRDATE